jgi:hypothetical protein
VVTEDATDEINPWFEFDLFGATFVITLWPDQATLSGYEMTYVTIGLDHAGLLPGAAFGLVPTPSGALH